MPEAPELLVKGKQRPFTGAEYLESLRDGREVYIYGERVKDVTKHPAFRNAAASVAKLYDALHDAKSKETLTTATDTGSGGYTHRFFKAARSREELMRQRDAIAAWARITYGWMGRSPDYKAAFLNTLGANAEFYGKFADNARAWHVRGQEAVLYVNHALVNPPIDRAKPVEQVKDVYITIQKETDAGIYVSGAKVVATNSALTHYNFLGQNMGQEINDPSMVVMFMAPMNTPGIKLDLPRLLRVRRGGDQLALGLSADQPVRRERRHLHLRQRVHPLGERVHPPRRRAPEAVLSALGLRQRLHHAGRDAARGEARLHCRPAGQGGARHRRRQFPRRAGAHRRGAGLAQPVLVALRRHGLQSGPVGDGAVLPNIRASTAYRLFMTEAYPAVRSIVEKVIASGLIYLPSHARDFKNPDIDKYLARYVRGSNGIDYKERIKIMKLLWDAVGSEFGARHELYEMNYAGSHELVRLFPLQHAQGSGSLKEMEALVEQCMADYDENGWKDPAYHDGSDVSALDRIKQ